MAMDASFTYETRSVTLTSFTVNFTDTTTGSPDSWLWDFGDGWCSTEQNPSHIYKGKWDKANQRFTPDAIFDEDGNQISYTVKLTAWKDGTILAPVSPPNPSSDITRSSIGSEFSSQLEAQVALEATLPYTDWVDTPPFNSIVYRMVDLAGGWEHRAGYRDTNMDFSVYPVANHVAWMEMRVNSMVFGDHKYAGSVINNEHFALKTGKWDSTLNEFDENEIAIKIGDLNVDVDYSYFSMEDYLGDSSTNIIRTVDAYEWGRRLLSQPLGVVGYFIYTPNPVLQLRTMAADDKDIAINIISANPNILTRPPVLYSGIKEAYFADGWENEKYVYIEQSKPYPCIIEFIDVYADTSNE